MAPAEFPEQARRCRPAASARRVAGVLPGEHQAAERRHLAVSAAAARGQPEEPASAAETAPRTEPASAQAATRSRPLATKAGVSRLTAAFPAAGSVPDSAEVAGRAWLRAAWAALDAREQPSAGAQAESQDVPAHAAAPAEALEAAAYAPAEPQQVALDAPAEVQAAQPVEAAVPNVAAQPAAAVGAAAEQPDVVARPVAEGAVGAPDAAARPAAEQAVVEGVRDAGPLPVAARAVEALGVEQRPAAAREAAEAQPDAVAARLGQVAAAAPAAAVSAGRLDRLRRRPGLGRRSSASPAHGSRSSLVASPTAQSSPAAGREVCSCVLFSRNDLFQARRDQQVCVRPDCGAVQIRRGIYFDAKPPPQGRHSGFIQP